MSRLLRIQAIRSVERTWLAATPPGALMARAAAAVADEAARIARTLPRATPIVGLIGPGNNGGDALLALGLLRARGFPVRALALNAEQPSAEDAARVWQQWQAADAPIDPIDALPEWLTQRPLVIDGLFGIGLQRPVQGLAAEAIRQVRDAGVQVVAVDIPSGLDADTGAVVGGSDGIAARADVTVTMIADKPGLHTAAGVDCAGRVVVAALGTDAALPDDPQQRAVGGAGANAGDFGANAANATNTASATSTDPAFRLSPAGGLFGPNEARALLRPRPRDSHKGSYGSVLVIGGATGTIGAALLAALGAQAAGAGKVFIGSPDAPVFDPGQPQLMTRSLEHRFDDLDAIAIGCGLGRSERVLAALERAIDSAVALVLDADALNLLADAPGLLARLASRGAPAVMTPHPLEAARLLGVTTAEVQRDRLLAAARLASRTSACVVLKGAGSVSATADGEWSVNDSGGPALATGGTGDVLAGVVAALLAQGLPPFDALRLAVWLHGRAGDLWQQQHRGSSGLSAARLPEWIVAAAAS